MPTMKELTDLIIPMLPASVQSGVETLLGVLVTLQDIFTNGLGAIFSKLAEWVTGQVMELLQDLMGSLGAILGGDAIELLALSIPIGIGGFSLFNIELSLGLKLGIEFDVDALINLVMDLVFKGISMFSPETSGAALTAGDVLRKALTFFSITPIFVAAFELSDFGGSPGFLDFMVASLGLELKISGSGFFELMLFSFKNGNFNMDDFFKVIAWGFKFSITISRMFTLLDFLTGGAGGSLNSIGKYIGLDAISITIYFTIAFEIIKRAATAIAPETGTMTISLIIGFTVSLGIDLFIAHLILTGTLELTLTLLQDLVSPAPLRIFIAIQLIITVSIGFLFWDWDFEFKWSPDGFEPPLGYELTPSTPADAVTAGALGGDSDGDGLSDKYEDETPGLDKNNPDSDDDGLDDKFETQTLKSDPASADTDGDGLDDLREYELKTDLLNPDTDFDGLNDYEEVVIYGTNPFGQDTDGDGLSDHYEVNHAWNMTGITPSVFGIMIGGEAFDDRTDPLNPDTDGDGLIDGEEGPRGIYYGPNLYNSTEQPEYTPDPPLFFNGGYTHPLDNDTDDDSYWQLYDGSKAPMDADRLFLMDMSDYMEIKGYSIIFIDVLTGEPEPARIVRTNPTNPDSDGDTGVTAQQRIEPPFGFFLNSDGYELSRDPPTDPLDGDTDDDGLIDGLEGMLRPDSNHTWGLNPDTDGDGLGDLQEIQLGTDGRSIDTDLDGVTDGDEFFRYGTNPFLYDTDGDGLSDSEELFYYHSNPLQQDSDGDGLRDYDEVWIYFSDPMDEDSDNDGLTDYEEVWIYYTDPYNEDTDGDLLLDGEEVAGLEYSWTNKTTQETFYYLVMTDPLKWDTDNDSILWLDQYGEMSQSMSDYEEWLLGTDPTRSDSDLDGISDGWEVYLGTDKIPWLDPIKLDPLSKDTDGDKLNDGSELIVVNQSTLLNPFVGYTLLMPFNTSAVLNDTDGDLIDDWTEISILGSRPDLVDTDNDTLTDYAEWKIYLTDPIKNDTDGDGLMDQHEVFGYDYSIYNNDSRIWYDNRTSLVSGFFLTGANNSDSDGDLLPDGAEIWLYTSDPTNPHEHDPDILDGMLIDSDLDGLYDGEEYYVYGTVASPEGGGPFEVDSDRDGLFDGLEVYETNSDPADWDTDDDTYSDGLEWYCGTGIRDNTTSAEEIQACFGGLVRIAVLSPVSKTYTSNSIPIVVYDSTFDMTDMTYRWQQTANETWHAMEGNWSQAVVMNQDVVRGDGYWSGLYIDLPYKNGTYELEVTASNATDTYTRTVKFNIQALGGDVVIVRPEAGQYSFIEFATPKLPIEVKVAPGVNLVKFRIKFGNGTIFQDNTTMLYETGLLSFYVDEQEFPALPGYTNYAIEVFANNTKGQEVVASVLITIKTPTVVEDILIIAGGGASLGLIGMIGRRAFRGGFKNPFKKTT
jgi:hypothetical protein